MNVLMSGWQLPPYISGGLGTAPYGLKKSLSKPNDVEGSFVGSMIFGGKNKSNNKLIDAIDGYVTNPKGYLNEFGHCVEFIHECSKGVSYVDAEKHMQQWPLGVEGDQSLIEVDQQGEVIFTGEYSPDILSQIKE